MTVHLVYPADPDRIAAPWSIGNNVSAGLRAAGYDVEQYDWEDTAVITPDDGDILLGHPHPIRGHTFCASLSGPWAKKIVMTPINIQGENLEFALSVIACCDHFIAIGGPGWGHLPAEHGIDYKTTVIDLAVEPKDFPIRKLRFNQPGERKFLFIGCIVPFKNAGFLSQLAAKTGYDFRHIGFGDIPNVLNYGYAHLEDHQNQDAVGHHDFLITPSVFDANPTTVLECGMIGLVSMCSPFCGWREDVTGIFPLDLDRAAECMEALQFADEGLLLQRADEVRKTIEEKYTWGRFVEQVCAVLS